MDAPLLAIGDGALGLWSALNEVYPTTARQRCWNHRSLNLAGQAYEIDAVISQAQAEGYIPCSHSIRV